MELSHLLKLGFVSGAVVGLVDISQIFCIRNSSNRLLFLEAFNSRLHQIVRLPNCQVTKLSSYQTARLPNCPFAKLFGYQIVSYQNISYQIVSYQNVSYQIISYQLTAHRRILQIIMKFNQKNCFYSYTFFHPHFLNDLNTVWIHRFMTDKLKQMI